MLGRRVWSDDEVQKLASNFLCVADEVWALEHLGDAGSRFFMEYGKRLPPDQWRPGTTKQGIYCMTPQGENLGAHFARHNREETIALLKEALSKWNGIVSERGLHPRAIPPGSKVLLGREGVAPRAGGTGRARPALVLQVNSRDLPRADGQFAGPPEYRKAWNQLWLDFAAEEAAGFLPEGKGPSPVPPAVVRRLAREALIDNVRGQSGAWPDSALTRAVLTTREISSTPDTRVVALEGEAAAADPGRSFSGTLYGQATFDRRSGRFVRFELVAAGIRTGGTGGANFRMEGEGASALGVSFIIEGQDDAAGPPGK